MKVVFRSAKPIPIILLAVMLAGSGCSDIVSTIRMIGREGTISTAVTKEELRDRLDQFEDSFEAQIRKASDELLDADDSRRMKRLTLIWQMRMIPMLRNNLDQQNPLGALLDAWTLCERMRQFLAEGDGKSLFGTHQQIAVRAATDAEVEIQKIASLVLKPPMMEDTRERVKEVATSHPLFGEFSGSDVRAAIAGSNDKVLQDVLAIPLTPFRWLGGVDETAQAIKGFTVVSSRLTDVVQGLAADARLQTQLLLLDSEDLGSVKSALKSMKRLSTSSERLATTAEKLPMELRKELTILLDHIDSDQPEVRKTITEAREMVDKLDPTGASVARAGDAWSGTARAIEEMVASFRRPVDAPPGEAVDAVKAAPTGGPPLVKAQTEPHDRHLVATTDDDRKSPPFDINDYAKTAEALTVTAKELQKLTAEIRQLGESDDVTRRLDELTKRVEGLVGQSQSAASGVADHTVWRLGQLTVFVVGLLIVYRFLAGRIGQRNAGHAGGRT